MDKNVMVVDDSSAIRSSVKLALELKSYGVIEAVDGKDALDKLDDSVDLIICDINMPEMDGIEFIKTIRNDDSYSSYKYKPVLMLTTETSEEKMDILNKLGIKAWIIKPFSSDDLISRVSKLI